MVSEQGEGNLFGESSERLEKINNIRALRGMTISLLAVTILAGALGNPAWTVASIEYRNTKFNATLSATTYIGLSKICIKYSMYYEPDDGIGGTVCYNSYQHFCKVEAKKSNDYTRLVAKALSKTSICTDSTSFVWLVYLLSITVIIGTITFSGLVLLIIWKKYNITASFFLSKKVVILLLSTVWQVLSMVLIVGTYVAWYGTIDNQVTSIDGFKSSNSDTITSKPLLIISIVLFTISAGASKPKSD